MFPNELYVRIIDKLDLDDRIEMTSISKRFNELLQVVEYKNQIRLTKIETFNINLTNLIIDFPLKTYFDQLKNVKKLRFVNKKKPNFDILKRLTYCEEINFKNCNFVNDKTIDDILELKYIKKLNLRGCELDDDSSVKVFEMKNLRELTFEFEELSSDVIEQLQHLKKIEVNSGFIAEETLELLTLYDHVKELQCFPQRYYFKYFERMKNLKKLKCYTTTISSTKIDLLMKIQNLKSITLSNCSFKEDLYLSKMNNLRKLKIVHSRRININNIREILNIPKLKTFCLHTYNRELFASLIEMSKTDEFKKFNKIERVKMYIEKPTEELISALGRIENLEKLTIHNEDITDDWIKRLSGLKKLKILDLKGCYNITTDSIDHLSHIKGCKVLI